MGMDLVQRGQEFVAHYDPKQTVGHGLVAALTSEVARLRESDELAAARETVRRLNRRCQSAERGLAEKVDELQRAGPSLGRALANAAATMYREQLADANAKLHALAADAAQLLQDMNTVPDIANAAVPFIERVAAIKPEERDA